MMPDSSPGGGGWRCCCGCFSSGDDFDRQDATDLGLLWYEWPDNAKGDWRIFGQMLVEVAGAGHVLFLPRKTEYAIVSVEIYNVQPGDVYSLYANRLNECNYFRAEYSFSPTSPWTVTISVHKCAPVGEACVETLLNFCTDDWQDKATHDPDAPYVIAFCFGREYAQALCSGTAAMSIAYHPGHVPGGYKTGIGHDCGREVYFDNYSYSEHYDSNPQCPGCGFCFCEEGKLISPLLTATYVGYDEGCNDCSGLTGITVEMLGDHCRNSAWSSDLTTVWSECFPVIIDGDGHHYVRWTITCPAHEPEILTNWQLGLYRFCLENPLATPTQYAICGWPGGVISATEESTCDPFCLVFEVDVYLCVPTPHSTICDGNPPPPSSCEWDGTPPYPEGTSCAGAFGDCGKIYPLDTMHRVHYKIIVTKSA